MTTTLMRCVVCKSAGDAWICPDCWKRHVKDRHE